MEVFASTAQRLLTCASVVLLTLATSGSLSAQNDVPGDPSGVGGDFDGLSSTAGGYDAYTGNVKRMITDVTVPGTAGTIPLQFTRIYNSRINAVPSISSAGFGDANWRHNYQWEGQITTNSTGKTVYQVGYPDGRVINFRLDRANQINDAFARGPAGTSDRFEVSPPRDPNHHYLHLSNGSQIRFSVVQKLIYADQVIDPYGATTALFYSNYTQGTYTSVLSQIMEPGGRSLYLHYETQYDGNGNFAGVTIKSVMWVDTQNNLHEDAKYQYYVYGGSNRPNEFGQTTRYCALIAVGYSQQQASAPNRNVAAKYTYYAADPGGAPPLLVSADDPLFAGPMHQIRYTYVTNAGYGVWGTVQSEANYTTGENVSSLTQDQPNTPNLATETRGDHADGGGTAISRTSWYGQNPGSTNAQGFQVTASTNYQGNPSYTYYNAQGDTTHGWGYVAKTIDASGAVTQFLTEPYTGKVTQTILPDGRTRSAVWGDKDGNASNPYYIFQTTDEHGKNTTYHRYPNTGYVYQVDYPDNAHEYYTYHYFSGPNGDYYKIDSYRNKSGALFTYIYGQNDNGQGPADLLKSITRAYADAAQSPHSEVVSFTYDAQNRVRSVQDQRGVKNKFSYNERGQITQILHVSEQPTQTHIDYGYDDDGNRCSVTDELVHTTKYTFDNYRRVTSVSVPVNATTTRKTQYTYERRDNQNTIIGSAGSHTSKAFSYMVLPSGRAIQHIFSPEGWMTDEYSGQSSFDQGTDLTQANPQSLYFTQCIPTQRNVNYDTMGRVLQYKDTQNFVWKSSYDNYGRASTATDPLNHVVTTAYYPTTTANGQQHPYAGLVMNVTTPGVDLSNNLTVLDQYTSYDPMGRLLAAVDPSNYTFKSGYDALGNLSSQSDGAQPNGKPPTGPSAHWTGYGYDQLGRKGSCTYPDATVERWTYDASGNVATFQNRAGAVCTFLYDLRNRCYNYSWSQGSATTNGTALAAAYVYDSANRLIETANDAADIVYEYDDSGALVSETERPGSLSAGLKTQYTRDQDGRVASITYPSDGNAKVYFYDEQGRCKGLGGSSLYTYQGTLLRYRQMANGLYTQYDYQNNGRIADVWHINGSASKNVSLRAYGYAPDGQVSWCARTWDAAGFGNISPSGSNLENGQGDAYYYYPDGRLFTACQNYGISGGNWPQAFSQTADSTVDGAALVVGGGAAPSYYTNYYYDAAGNRIQANLVNQGVVPYSDNQIHPGQNQYNGSTYDNNGNTTSSATGWTYVYDAENHLISATGPGGQTVSFGYDPLGRVIGQFANGVGTLFFYAGGQRIEEHDFYSNALRYLYLYDAPGDDTLLFRYEAATGNALWYQYDALGNTTHVSNSAGQVVEQYLYDAYGTPSVYDAAGNPRSTSLCDNRYLFKGAGAYEWLGAAGLYYCRARMYLPVHGRWLQPDPVGQAGGLNLYAYCHNDPVNGSDPTGLVDGGSFGYDSSGGFSFGGGGDSSSGFDWNVTFTTGGSVDSWYNFGIGNFNPTYPANLNPYSPQSKPASDWSPIKQGNGQPGWLTSLIPGVRGIARMSANYGLYGQENEIWTGGAEFALDVLTFGMLDGGGIVAENAFVEGGVVAERGIAGSAGGGLLPGGTGRAFAGHGVENGFLGTTIVPEGTTLMIPGRIGTMLPDALGQAIETGSWDTIAANPRWMHLMEGSTSYLPGAEIPNLLLRPASDLWLHLNSIRVTIDTPLAQLLKSGMGNLEWAACRQSTGGY